MNITFYDVLGIDPSDSDRESTAACLWPNTVASLTPGFNVVNDAADIVKSLQDGVVFKNIRPGVDSHITLGGGAAGQFSFAADLHVTGIDSLTSKTFYLRAMPDVGIQLFQTDPDAPAQVFFASDGRGFEVLIDRLPVRIFLKRGLATALATSPEAVGAFDKSKVDGFAYILQDDAQPSEIDAIVRLHLTPTGDVILEPTVPISLGAVRFMGLPAKNVYDIQLIPSPNLREYFEWTRNNIGTFISNPLAKGAIGFRSIDLDFSKPPFSDLAARLKDGAVNVDDLELVLEDVVVPLMVPMLPIPSHGTFGFRRKITDRNDIHQAFDLLAAPVKVRIHPRLYLTIEKFYFATGDPPTIQFQAGLIWETTSGATLGGTMGIDDDWTITVGFVMGDDTTPVKFTIADATVSLVGIKLGFAVGRLGRHFGSWSDYIEILGDFAIISKPSGENSSWFKMRSLTGKDLHIVLHDIGWKLGHKSLDGLQMPDGVQLTFGHTDKFRFIIEEMGFVEEPNGAPYFSFSGGVALGFGDGNAVKPSGDPNDNQGSGFGIRVRRLRFRINGDSTQPRLKIDGVFLNLHYGTVWIEGFGYISDYEDSGWAINEWGFGVKVQVDAIAMRFVLAAEFVKGSRRSLADPTNAFDYFMASLVLGWLPAGSIGLYDIRALVAENMAPNLDTSFPSGEGMALFKWHQDHDGALTMPASRNLADWIAEHDAISFGVGCGLSFNGCGNAMKIDIFIFFSKSRADTGLLAVGDLFLLKNPKPVAFVAIEYDIDTEKFGVMAGVDIGLADFAGGSIPSWLAHVARLTGTIYFGNKPWALAIGHLADQRSWLSLLLDWDIWLVIKFQFGIGLEIVDGGPKGYGLVMTFNAGADWGIGSFVVWGTYGFIIGTWKTGSDSVGMEAWYSIGFKINLFWIFSFGADVSLRLEYLGKHPWYISLSAEIRIDTPWYLPDVTVKFEKTFQEPLPFDTATITQCLSSSSGIEPTRQSESSLLSPGLSDGIKDPKHLYTFNQLVGLLGMRINDTHLLDTLPILSTDATIAINFTQPLSNDSLIATNTYDGSTDTGVQKVQDLQVRYALKSISIRRSPRFGPTAGMWSDLLKDSDTEFSIGGAAPESVTFAWDVDTRADGRLAPKRLLVNSSSPYSFAIAAPQNDEEAVGNDPDFPCCDHENERKLYPKQHRLFFDDIAVGLRVPTGEQFSGNGAWWRWLIRPTPVITPGDPVYVSSHVARFRPPSNLIVGCADCADPILSAQVTLEWEPIPATLYFEGYYGLQFVAQQKVDLHKSGNRTCTCSVQLTSAGMTRLVLRVEMDLKDIPVSQPLDGIAVLAQAVSNTTELGTVAVLEMSYITLADAIQYVAGVKRCENAGRLGPPGSDTSGKLAWLPNHDYETVVTGKIDMSHKTGGSRSLQIGEAFYFRTKGLPGLNACPNVGDDLRRHVESTYPAIRPIPLYREEPSVLAFTEGMSSVLPIDRVPKAGDPPEKEQMFPLILNVDRIESLDGLKRLTVPSNDWISAHRANPYPIICYPAEPEFAHAKTRLATILDPLFMRYEAIMAVSPSCSTPKTDCASQVLLHEPIDGEGNPTAWEPTTGYRATVRQKDGPFTLRSGFDLFDLNAFIRQVDGAATAPDWGVDDGGNIVAPAPTGGRHYLSCGELTWDHLQVHARIDLRDAIGGIAVGVGEGTPVRRAIIATVEPDGGSYSLVLRKRDEGGENELGRAAVEIKGPLLLNVVAFDDLVRAAIGEVVVAGPRGGVREGRIALVADGAAMFASIQVDALDMYTYDFVTSRYHSFQEHIDSFDGRLGALTTGAFGGAPATIVSVLAAHGVRIAPLMLPAADPQERQMLFASIVSMLGIGLRKNPDGLGLARLIDGSGTFGLLFESPEPISLVRDVLVTLVKHVHKWVPRKVAVGQDRPEVIEATPTHKSPPFGGVEAVVSATIPPLQTGPMPNVRFEQGAVTMPKALARFEPGDLIIRVAETAGQLMLHVFDAPKSGVEGVTARGNLREMLSMAQAMSRPDFAALAELSVESIAVVHVGGVIGSLWSGHWEDDDVSVTLVPLSNGSETVSLLISRNGVPLTPGRYTLHFTIDRDRWRVSGTTDSEQHYHQERLIDLHW